MKLGDFDDYTRVYVSNAIKKAFRNSENYKQFLIQKTSDIKGPNGGKKWECNHCGKLMSGGGVRCPYSGKKKSEFEVDHIDPVVPIGESSENMHIGTYYSRVYCSYDNLQILCKGCHKTKSDSERAKRWKEIMK